MTEVIRYVARDSLRDRSRDGYLASMAGIWALTEWVNPRVSDHMTFEEIYVISIREGLLLENPLLFFSFVSS